MTLEFAFFNVAAMIAAFVAKMAIGALWYSPLLSGNIRLRPIGRRPGQITRCEAGAAMALSRIPATLSVARLKSPVGAVV